MDNKRHKLIILWAKLQVTHPIACKYAHDMLSLYPNLQTNIVDIREGINVGIDQIEYEEYADKVLEKYPELRYGLVDCLKILCE